MYQSKISFQVASTGKRCAKHWRDINVRKKKKTVCPGGTRTGERKVEFLLAWVAIFFFNLNSYLSADWWWRHSSWKHSLPLKRYVQLSWLRTPIIRGSKNSCSFFCKRMIFPKTMNHDSFRRFHASIKTHMPFDEATRYVIFPIFLHFFPPSLFFLHAS